MTTKTPKTKPQPANWFQKKVTVASLFLMILLGVATVQAQGIENGLLKVELKDQAISLTSTAGGKSFIPKAVFPQAITGSEVRTQNHDVWGEGKVLELVHANGWKTTLTLYPECPFVHVHTQVINGKEAYQVNAFDFVKLDVDLGLPLDKIRVLGTAGLTTTEKIEGSYTFSAVADPETRNGVVCGWLTHEQGTGLFFPKADAGKLAIAARVEFGSYLVKPEASRATEILLLGYFDDTRLGLEAYADAVAKHYGIKLKPAPGVYCTWYHARASNAKALAANTAFVAKHLKPFGLGVMQIDDKWQAILPKGFEHKGEIQTTGPIKVFVDSNNNYPDGMAPPAKDIASHGMVAGIWFMPFAGNFRNPYFDKDIFAQNLDGTPFHDKHWSGTCIDSTSPKGEAYIRACVKRIYDWGYRYFKIDGLHTGAATRNIYVNKGYNGNDGFGKVKLHDPEKTPIQAYRKCLEIVREVAPEAFVLGCNVSQNMRSMGAAFGLIPAMRIGPDNDHAASGGWGHLIRGPWHGTNLYFLNGRVWHNDPDPVYVRPKNPVERARWMCSWIAVAGAMHTSSEQYDQLPPDRLDMLKRCLPSHAAMARPVDYLETNNPQIWLAGDRRMNLIGLFNWSEKSPTDIVYALGKLGLAKDKTYVAFDFWANTFVAPFQGTLKQTLPGGTCRVLAVKEVADHPQLLSTSRHITQGLIDVIEEAWDAGSKTLSGKSHVVAGDLYELRIALPAGGTWKVKSAKAGDREMKVGEPADGGLRVSLTPEASATVEWRIEFE